MNSEKVIVTSTSSISFMSQVYLWMVLGVLITSTTAYAVSYFFPDMMMYLMLNPGYDKYITATFSGMILFQLALVLVLSGLLKKISANTAIILYLIYTISVGITSSVIFITYTKTSIVSAFLITAFAFAGLSAFGFFTKKDLRFIGTFCTMGLFGLIGLLLYGVFVPSFMTDKIQIEVAIVGLIVFSGLTAFDTQMIKNYNVAENNADQTKKAAIFGALKLYLDFINLLFIILRLNRR